MKKLSLLVASFSCMLVTVALISNAIGQDPAPGRPAAEGQAPGAPGAPRPNQQNLIPYPLVPYQMQGYSMELPYQIGAEVLAGAYPAPKKIVDVGSYQGQFLQAFMQRFPGARGQWTEPVTPNENNAKRKLARFGDRVDYVIGCPGRDIALGCLPKDADVIITAWVSHHQPIHEITRIYGLAHQDLPAGGWFIVLDHITAKDATWEKRLDLSRWNFNPDSEGPPMEPAVRNVPHPTLDQEIAAFKTAGFTDFNVVWQSFDTVLFMARK